MLTIRLSGSPILQHPPKRWVNPWFQIRMGGTVPVALYKDHPVGPMKKMRSSPTGEKTARVLLWVTLEISRVL